MWKKDHHLKSLGYHNRGDYSKVRYFTRTVGATYNHWEDCVRVSRIMAPLPIAVILTTRRYSALFVFVTFVCRSSDSDSESEPEMPEDKGRKKKKSKSRKRKDKKQVKSTSLNDRSNQDKRSGSVTVSASEKQLHKQRTTLGNQDTSQSNHGIQSAVRHGGLV